MINFTLSIFTVLPCRILMLGVKGRDCRMQNFPITKISKQLENCILWIPGHMYSNVPQLGSNRLQLKPRAIHLAIKEGLVTARQQPQRSFPLRQFEKHVKVDLVGGHRLTGEPVSGPSWSGGPRQTLPLLLKGSRLSPRVWLSRVPSHGCPSRIIQGPTLPPRCPAYYTFWCAK